jgi:hypothetical protein
MNEKKLARIRRRLEQLRSRAGNIRPRELSGLARSLGRTRHRRGKEPTYISELLPTARPVSIPSHPGSLKRYTAENILDRLEVDIFLWEEVLARERGDSGAKYR